MDILSRYNDKTIEEIWSEDRRYQMFYDAELAYLKAEAKQGSVPSDVASYLESNRPQFTADEIRAEEKLTKHEVVAFINVVTKKLDKYTEFFHRGLTSSDIMDTVFSLQLKESIDYVNSLTVDVISVLFSRADEFKYTVCAGRTHGVHAEPYFFGLRFLGVSASLKRCYILLHNCRNQLAGKLSGALGIYTNLDPSIEPEFLKELGLNMLPMTTQIVPRDIYAPVLFYIAMEASVLDKLAEDMRILQMTEIGESQELFSAGQAGSSAMPHKRNPVRWERVTGLSRVLRSQVNVGLENIPLWFERDISHSSTERVVYPMSFDLLAFMLRETKELLEKSTFDSARMSANIAESRNLLYSSRALATVQEKLGRGEAYKLVQDISKKVLDGEISDFIDGLKATGLLTEKEIEKITDLSDLYDKVDLIYRRVSEFLRTNG
jgi:adenylosuccinate lyase